MVAVDDGVVFFWRALTRVTFGGWTCGFIAATFGLVALATLAAGTALASDQGGSATATAAAKDAPSDKKAEPRAAAS